MWNREEKERRPDERLIAFPGGSPPPDGGVISQERLAEEREAACKAQAALAELEALRVAIREDLLAGANVQCGPLRAYLKPRQRSAYLAKACSYLELVVE